ncbi:hypothetical protein K493DRAFT_320382 [Basidiobolus meristosporus CBS 931.73]|uniref:Uncharacterized protein n=1 Tax=Basidiobolus meristosporus CBS 931.73 TaxID=1314790 RepID=A0A1Y1XAQ1_9FUNG|nr:hypothetical protein K493DRAFT_320382 [Basidiobolus meristosporus CBS 931.73]|eukprot:ORX82797.1 hypothetical protein K493DRAFT_320382 [Basidiobolus meristosporus CBS 931.73]
MCWNSVNGNGSEPSEEDDPFADFSSDEEDPIFSNIHGALEEPVEEFIVGTEFQLSAHELRGMFKTEIEHKSSMQRWYAKADRCTNHDRIGLKNPVTWPDRFASKSSQRG